MTVAISQNLTNSDVVALQSRIAALSARTDSYSTQELKKAQEQFVSTLFDVGHFTAASVLSTVSYNTSKLPAAIAAAITNFTALVTKYGSSSTAGIMAADSLDQAQRQGVIELMSNGAMPAASILAAMT